MKFRHTLAASVALIPVALLSTPAFAQSTGSQDFENEIIVTGSRSNQGIAGVVTPDTTKAKVVLTQEFIERQSPGQTVNDLINQLPGVSFQNNDPFGSAGGKMTIRGFDNTRINQTFDGIPLNDSGNYALYSNQQLDPELIDQVNVNLGSTDVDSPTAAASGSTVNYRTRTPGEEFGVKVVGSAGDFNFFRIFGMVDTGILTPWGTRAFFSASQATNDTVFGNVDLPGVPAHRGRINKKQFNGKIYQPLGDNGDFIALSGHYNENRNNFFGSVGLRNVHNTALNTVPNIFPQSKKDRDYNIARCQINTVARPGQTDTANSCGSTFDERMNPSNTGNIRLNSRFTLAEGLVLTVDPSYQYTKANGGGTAVGTEARRDVNPLGTPAAANCNNTPNSAVVSCQMGYIGGTPYYGRDLNGDGDLLDTVRVLAPNQTQTHRYGLITGLRYEMGDHTFRVFYSWERARHRQTGQTNFLRLDGSPTDPFPVNDPLKDADGNVLQRRDRKSIASLNLFGGEYRGEFGRLTVQAGGSYKMFKRDLNNYCATSSATGFVECFGTNTAGLAAWLAANPTVVIGVDRSTTPATNIIAPVQGPQQRIRKYNKFTPNVGLTYDATDDVSIFANYSKGVQVPGTDNLYNAFYFPADSDAANPVPETTDNFDLGVRYTTSQIQAQVGVWYTIFKDRLASSFDPDTERNVYRNLGRVDKYGIDGSLSVRPIPEFAVTAFGSYLKSKIKDDVVNGVCTAVSATCANIGDDILAPTKGKRESGSPVYTFGGRVQGELGPLSLGAQVKRTGPRYVNDQNTPLFQTVNGVANTPVFGAKAPAYTLVDLDARLGLEWAGLGDKVYFQVNVTNLFDKLYVGGFDGQLANNSVPFTQIGAPRTFIGSIVVGF
ncbi:iron complex outermembrane receptor protein [Sphingopyxis sp. OAS728]|uniref:TonB-dependent receptor n=1 Tax=Sphingopyxis sp. OAS728 TaxID=2663823 RepID=UPI00178A7E30|nr:TonB-dependent receptor [Sphingopyxis sp. OAS728]MBE1527758.1 iron complex outermembrane receptor protein [Sphingopyxis sp. OAS728]